MGRQYYFRGTFQHSIAFLGTLQVLLDVLGQEDTVKVISERCSVILRK
jgi:hypothetical protein